MCSSSHIYTYRYICICTYMSMYICIHICIYICIYHDIDTSTFICMRIHIYRCMRGYFLFTCACIYTDTCTDAYTYEYKDTCTVRLPYLHA